MAKQNETTAPAPATTTAPVASERGNCLCGCGTTTSRGSIFAAGHDARLKGRLQRAFRGAPRHDDRTMAETAGDFLRILGRVVAPEAQAITRAYNPAWLALLPAPAGTTKAPAATRAQLEQRLADLEARLAGVLDATKAG